MSLDSKQPESIPNLEGGNLVGLRARLESSRPLGTYRFQDGEFLCCYTECGVFVDKFGSLSRSHTLEWEGRPSQAFLIGNYVLAVGKEFLEIWDVERRSLRQIITGKDIRVLPCSSAGGSVEMAERGIIVAMAHPNRTGQLIFELRIKDRFRCR